MMGYTDIYVTIKGEPTIKRITRDANRKETISYHPISEHGWTKSIECFIVLRREGINQYSLKPIKAFFLQKVKVSVENLKKYRYFYLKLESHNVMLRNMIALKGVVCTKVDFQENQTQESINIQLIGKAVKISLPKLNELRRQENYCGLFNQTFSASKDQWEIREQLLEQYEA